MKKIFFFILMLILLLTSCSSQDKESKATEEHKPAAVESVVSSDAAPEHETVTFEVENFGNFVVETFPEYAPDTVAHFLKLVNSGFYNGFTIEQIDHSFAMLSSKSPQDLNSDSAAYFNYSIPGEFTQNGRSNNLPLEKYTLALYHAPDQNDSAMAQFMIFLTNDHEVNGSYAGFAKVVEGTDVIDKMAGTLVDERDAPVLPIVMKKVYINE